MSRGAGISSRAGGVSSFGGGGGSGIEGRLAFFGLTATSGSFFGFGGGGTTAALIAAFVLAPLLAGFAPDGFAAGGFAADFGAVLPTGAAFPLGDLPFVFATAAP